MKVSVITPFYNGNAYIRGYEEMIAENERQLSSKDVLEVILVNDSPKVPIELSGLHASRKNWRIITNEKNMGIHASRIHGLSEATGDYVIFLDQDDTLEKDAIACFLEVAREQAKEAGQKKCYQVIVSNALLEQADGSWIEWYRTAHHKRQIDNLRTYVCVGTQILSPGQCMMPAEIIPREWLTHVITKNGADDYFLWLLMLSKGIGFYYLDETLYRHHRTGENVSQSTEQTDRSTEQFMRYLKESGFPSLFWHLLARQTRYKAAFRKASPVGKLVCSLMNADLFIANLRFKIATKTGYGFNR